jgi:hypothetical protein
MKTTLINTVITVIAISLLIALIEGFSIWPGYVTQQAIIINVQDDSKWGYIGEDKRTLVEWTDGSRGYIPGAMGESGEMITSRRQLGTTSLLGWFGDRRQ